MANEILEKKIIELIATDRIEIPISSISGKLKRIKPKLAEEIVLPENKRYNGERAYAKIEEENKEKARTLKEAIEEFCQKYPRYGEVLKGIIAEKRIERETHLYFGLKEGCHLTSEDYIAVLKELGFGKITAERLYPELIEISRNMQKKRGNPERSILINK
ncbi:MAG: hypothetical protein N3D20_02595 [Candidatus Pacearchaeota archaeon]|nr:hypothetical protein [Candidatus Pacearchaeota archaeon]